jgi:hypothetical protein
MMVSQALAGDVVKELDMLPFEEQRRVLEFAHALVVSKRKGTPGAALLGFMGTVPADDLRRMSEAIEAGCERVDADAW